MAGGSFVALYHADKIYLQLFIPKTIDEMQICLMQETSNLDLV